MTAGGLRELLAADVEWVVNDIAELGVKIGGQFFFLYKGSSLVYDDPVHTDEGPNEGKPMMWRPVFKREFGECCHPLNYDDPRKIGTVSLDDSDEWKPLPSGNRRPAAPAGGEDGAVSKTFTLPMDVEAAIAWFDGFGFVRHAEAHWHVLRAFIHEKASAPQQPTPEAEPSLQAVERARRYLGPPAAMEIIGSLLAHIGAQQGEIERLEEFGSVRERQLGEIAQIAGQNIAHRSTVEAVQDLRDDTTRLHREKMDAIERATALQARLESAEKALRRLKSYNEDIRDGKINYRAQDHIDAAEAALPLEPL